jgi:hypothetical protein
MTRLDTERQRLFGLTGNAADTLLSQDGQTRTVVVELARPAEWAPMSRVWQAVQSELGLPAPAIAVNGADGYQLWFSLTTPLDAARANAWGSAIQARYLADVPSERIRVWPCTVEGAWQHAQLVPAQQPDGTRWAAFVAPDLAPIFSEDASLDIPPGIEGQADLLAGLQCIPLEDALKWLALSSSVAPAEVQGRTRRPLAPHNTAETTPSAPHTFLLRVMNDERVDLHLRIEAAKALLPYC